MRAIIIEYTDDGEKWFFGGVRDTIKQAEDLADEIGYQVRFRHAAITPIELISQQELDAENEIVQMFKALVEEQH